MGLDMYLYLRKEDYKGARVMPDYPKELGWFRDSIEVSHGWPSITTKVDYLVGYWRKEWDLHSFIVANCCGEDEGFQDTTLSLEFLPELVSYCHRQLRAISDDELRLRATNDDLERTKIYEYTIELLQEVIKFLEEHEDYEAVYHASW